MTGEATEEKSQPDHITVSHARSDRHVVEHARALSETSRNCFLSPTTTVTSLPFMALLNSARARRADVVVLDGED